MDTAQLPAFADTVQHLLESRRKAERGAKRAYDELLALAIRKVDEIAPINVSKGASEKASELGLRDLRTYCWFCPEMGRQRDIEDPKQRRLFLWEHYHQVSDIQREIEGLGWPPAPGKVVEALSKMSIVWVLRTEATRLGSRSRTDPAAHYAASNVPLAHAWDAPTPARCEAHWKRGGGLG